MTDKTVPDVTNHDRRLAHSWAESVESNPDSWGRRQVAAARVILNAVPTPPLQTLADMTPKERAACQWMQADVDDEITAGIITKINQADAHLIDSDGETWFLEFDTVTPRPDLPRLEWPGTEQGSASDPRPEGDPDD